jgi:hypothetical protein
VKITLAIMAAAIIYLAVKGKLDPLKKAITG